MGSEICIQLIDRDDTPCAARNQPYIGTDLVMDNPPRLFGPLSGAPENGISLTFSGFDLLPAPVHLINLGVR